MRKTNFEILKLLNIIRKQNYTNYNKNSKNKNL